MVIAIIAGFLAGLLLGLIAFCMILFFEGKGVSRELTKEEWKAGTRPRL